MKVQIPPTGLVLVGLRRGLASCLCSPPNVDTSQQAVGSPEEALTRTRPCWYHRLRRPASRTVRNRQMLPITHPPQSEASYHSRCTKTLWCLQRPGLITRQVNPYERVESKRNLPPPRHKWLKNTNEERTHPLMLKTLASSLLPVSWTLFPKEAGASCQPSLILCHHPPPAPAPQAPPHPGKRLHPHHCPQPRLCCDA